MIATYPLYPVSLLHYNLLFWFAFVHILHPSASVRYLLAHHFAEICLSLLKKGAVLFDVVGFGDFVLVSDQNDE